MPNARKPTARKPRSPQRVAPRWRRRPEHRPDEIADAGLRLFSARGYLNVSVDDIARAAGVTKGAVYHHFGGKEDLLVAAVDRYLQRTFDSIGAGKPLAAGEAPGQRLQSLLWAAWQFWHSVEFQGLFRLVLGEAGEAVPAVRERFLSDGPHRGWKVLAGLIKQGQDAGEFRADVDANSVARLIASGLVLQILLRCLTGAPPRVNRDDFNREFQQITTLLAP